MCTTTIELEATSTEGGRVPEWGREQQQDQEEGRPPVVAGSQAGQGRPSVVEGSQAGQGSAVQGRQLQYCKVEDNQSSLHQ